MNSPPYVLYAEDDANTAQLFVSVLTQHKPGLKIVHVWNGEETMEFLHARGRFDGREPQNPAVIFLDLEMPGGGGHETLTQIRADAALRTLPAVIFSAPGNAAEVRRSYELGANAHVIKPANFRRFADFVRTLGDFWLTVNESPMSFVPQN